MGLEQIFGALAFYLANRETVDHYLREGQREFDALRRQARRSNPALYATLAESRRRTHTPRARGRASWRPPISTHKIVIGLRRREPSVDFLSAHVGGIVGVPDPDVLRIAAESARILVSHDRKTMPGHFARCRETRSSPGVIIVPQDVGIGAAIEDLLLI